MLWWKPFVLQLPLCSIDSANATRYVEVQTPEKINYFHFLQFYQSSITKL